MSKHNLKEDPVWKKHNRATGGLQEFIETPKQPAKEVREFVHVSTLTAKDWADAFREKRAKPMDFEVCNQCKAHVGPEARAMYEHKKSHAPIKFTRLIPWSETITEQPVQAVAKEAELL